MRDGHPPSILCAGYVGSTLMGGLFILGGFDSLAAKLLSFVAAVGLIAPLSLVRDKLYVARCASRSRSLSQTTNKKKLIFDTCIRTILLTVLYEGLLVGFWFIDHAYAGSFFFFQGSESLVYGSYLQSSATMVYALYWDDSVSPSLNLSACD